MNPERGEMVAFFLDGWKGFVRVMFEGVAWPGGDGGLKSSIEARCQAPEYDEKAGSIETSMVSLHPRRFTKGACGSCLAITDFSRRPADPTSAGKDIA
jgi:hypothetical protein